jgi:nucleoside-diphosphate-sugar epimerase
MHPADMAAWLLWLLVHGPERSAVNMGGSEAISIHDLATKISSMAGSPSPTIRGNLAEPDYYVADLTAANILGLKLSINLEQCIEKSLRELALEKDN